MSFYNLPDLCLLGIFNNLPLQDLCLMDQVNPRWYLVQQTAFRQRRSIILSSTSSSTLSMSKSFSTPPGKDRIEWSLLKCYPITRDTSYWLMETFPKIESLQICFPFMDQTTVHQVMCLLTRWSATLKSLKLFCQFSPFLHIVNNRMPNLKHLTLDSVDRANVWHTDFAIISRLEEFYINGSCNNEKVIWKAIKQYGPSNQQLKRLGIGTRIFNQEILDTEPTFAKRFTHLRVNLSCLDRFCQNFSSLTNLWLFVASKLTMSQLSHSLAILQQLKSLRLDFQKSPFYLNPGDLSTTNLKHCNYVPVSKVKSLTVTLNLESYRNLAQLNIGQVFPSLQVFKVIINKSRVQLACMMTRTKYGFKKWCADSHLVPATGDH